MAKITQLLPTPDGVVAGGTATFRIPVGRRIHSLYFTYNYDETNQNVSHFTDIRIYINGYIFYRITGEQRNILNKFDRLEDSVGVLEIPFDRKFLKTAAGQDETSLNTGVSDSSSRKISSMYMEIDISKDAVITPIDLSLYAKESDSIVYNADKSTAGPGLIPYIYVEQRSVGSVVNDLQISDLIDVGINSPAKSALNRITFIPATGTINNIIVERNGYIIWNRTDAVNRTAQKNGVRTPQSGYFTLDTTENGYGGDVIDLQNLTDFRYVIKPSAATTITIISEYLGVLIK